jgi:protein gp37
MIGPEMETPMTVLAFRQPDKDAKLAQLAVDIRQHLHASAASAIEAGRMLIEAKAMLRHGDWLPWLRVHVEISGRTASDYMRLARDPNSQHAADLSIRAALEQQRAGKKHQQAEGKKAATGQYIMLATLGEPIAYPCRASPALFNTTNEHISWAAFSWNPVTGCRHGCVYCYAREIALSPTKRAHFLAGFEPVFHHERLSAPANTKVPSDAAEDPRRKRVFVVSMGDLFGRWVPREWIVPILESCSQNPQWDYLMLTKFPGRYLEFLDLMPPSAWLGTSVDEQKRVRIAEQAFQQISGVRNKWLCLEPMKEELRFSDLSMFNWVVIGSQTATRQPGGVVPAFAPPFEWVARIWAQATEAGCKVYLKPNLLGATNPQSPGMVLPQEVPN